MQKSKFLASALVAIPLFIGLPVVAYGEQPVGFGSLINDQESALWSEVQKGNSVDDYEVYLAQYPNGKYVALAKSRLAKLKEQAASEQALRDQAAWDSASATATEASYQNYLNNYPKGRYAVLAQARITKLKKEKAEISVKVMQPGQTFRDCPDCPEMVVVPSGSAKMGQTGVEPPRRIVEFPSRSISGLVAIQELTKPKQEDQSATKYSFVATINVFALSKTEVTQGQWKAIMGYNPSEFRDCGDSCPVENISWQEVKNFIQKLNKKTGMQYRLPSEEEWEYACRAGKQNDFCGGDEAGSFAWYRGNADNKIHQVASKRANAWGLYDMSGNVWEWVEDSWHDSYNGAPRDGSAWIGDSQNRVLRGGSWFSEAKDMHATRRFSFDNMGSSNNVGFRVARMIQ